MIGETTIYLIILFISAFGALSLSGNYYYQFKAKISEIKIFVDVIDKALYDDTITESEFVEIYERAKRLLNLPKIRF